MAYPANGSPSFLRHIQRDKVNLNNADATYTLSGINGQSILDDKAVDGKIIVDLNGQSKGIYLLKVQSGEQIKTYKLVNR